MLRGERGGLLKALKMFCYPDAPNLLANRINGRLAKRTRMTVYSLRTAIRWRYRPGGKTTEYLTWLFYADWIVRVRPKRENMREVIEAYRRIGDPDDRFDVEFWQSRGDQVIFEAALEMISDYLILRCGHVDQPRLQRTVESFEKA